MPAGTDLVTWSPRVGDTGDDRYDIPADARRLACTLVVSDPPLLSEINDPTPGGANANALNQILAECNRRRMPSATYCAGPNFSALSYLADNARPLWSVLNTLKATIGKIRLAEGLAAYTWPKSVWAGGDRPLCVDVLNFRKALATDRISVFQRVADAAYPALFREGNGVWPPDQAPVVTSYSYAQHFRGGAIRQVRRAYRFFRTPSGIPALGAAKVNFIATREDYGGATGWNLRLYSSDDVPTPLGASGWGYLDSLEFEEAATTFCPVTNQTYSKVVDVAAPGAFVAYVFVTSVDDGGADPADGTDQEMRVDHGGSIAARLDLYTS